MNHADPSGAPPPGWELFGWMWERHERNPVNTFPLSPAADGYQVTHPASRASMDVEEADVRTLQELGLVRGRTELSLTRLGHELGYGLWRGPRLSVEARQLLSRWRGYS